jgi:uncharacterized membrane protein YeaQ/YmgE (transglycosylase-associated protein family)
MSLLGFFFLLVIAGLAGAVGQAVGGFARGGCIVAVLVGFAGAWLGTWIAAQFDLPPVFVVMVEGEDFPVFWAVVGAAVLSAVLGLFARGGRRA